MFNEIKNPLQLKDHILMRLGAPIINIEVTQAQIFDCIQRALELYGEYHYNGLNRTFLVVDTKSNKSGVVDLSGHKVFAITQIISGQSSDLLSFDGQALYPWVSDLIMGMAGTGVANGGVSSFGPNAYGADLTYFTILNQYWTMMQQAFSPKPDYWFNDDTGQLKVVGEIGDAIIIEAWVKSFVDTDKSVGSLAGYATAGDLNGLYTNSNVYDNPEKGLNNYVAGGNSSHSQGAFNNRWVKDYATALVKEINGQILAKHQGLQLPGGTSIDGVRLIEEARMEKERLREELDSLEAPPGIMIG